MTKTYLIRLRPLGRFFFGGEQTFGEGAGQSYVARSNYLPQQTSILGMLRYELLCRKNYLPVSEHLAEAEKLIGPRSFNVQALNVMDYGLIQSLSPVFVYSGDQVLYPTPMDTQMKVSYVSKADEHLATAAQAVYRFTGNEQLKEDPWFSLYGYDPKTYYKPTLCTLYTAEEISLDSVFITNSQVGITKGESGQTATNAFYRMFAYQFAKPYMGFCCWVRLTGEWPEADKTSLVFLGAERALFRLSVEEADWQTDYADRFKLYSPSSTVDDTGGRYKVTLLSDARVSADLYDACDFALSDTVSFRYIATRIKSTGNYHQIRKNADSQSSAPIKSATRIHLLQRGSVLWTRQLPELMNKLNNPTFSQIGYNVFQTQLY